MRIDDRYTLEAPLEQGRFGTLYRAVDSRRAAARDRADVAVWVSPHELAEHAPTLAAFRRDLERVRQLDHPNIARVLDVGQDGERLFVVSELVDGETLRNVLDALGPERLDRQDADQVVEALTSALAYAHENGVAHGDVRAENVVVTSDQRIRLTNFMVASSARGTPFARALLDDMRGLAVVAREVYFGSAARHTPLEHALRELPLRWRKQIEMALAAEEAGGVDELPAAELFPIPDDPVRMGARRRTAATARSASPWRWALPAAGFAAIGVALYAGDDVEWQSSLRDAANALRANMRKPADAVPPAGDAHGGADGQGAADAATTHVAATPAVAPPVAARTAPAETQRSDAGAARDGSADTPRRNATLSAPSITVRENQRVAKIAVIRGGDLTHRLDFVWHTRPGTAHAGDDYADLGAQVESFAPGESKHTLYVPLASDTRSESAETFYVRIEVDGRAEPTTAEVRIIDDDVRTTTRR